MKRKIHEVQDKNSILNYIPNKTEKVICTDVGSKKIVETSYSIDDLNESDLVDDFYPGYVIKNFDKMVTEVFNNKHDANLFSPDEINIIDSYRILSISCQKIFLKMYNRQWRWQRFDKNINSNSLKNFQSLLKLEFITNDLSKLDLKEKLNLLLVDEIEKIVKKFKIKPLSKKKFDLVDSIVKATNQKNVISNFFQFGNSTKNSLLLKIENELESYLQLTYKLTEVVRNTFCKITTIFSLTTSNWDDCSHLGEKNQKELFFLLQIEKGEILLPSYKLSRISNIFENQNSLESYIIALEYSLALCHFLGNNKLDEAYEVFQCVLKRFGKSYLQAEENESETCLKMILKSFTLKSLLIRIYSSSVNLLEKRRQYNDAVDILKMLITVTKSSIQSKSRGKWYLRLCVNYKTHLNNLTESIYWLEEALRDNSIPEYFKLTFRNRFDRLKKNKIYNKLTDFEESNDNFHLIISDENIQIITQKFIEAPRQYDVIDPCRPRYIWKDITGEIHCHVEDFVIYYSISKEGFTKGIHGETGTFILYFLLLFYDIIYADVPDVFYSWRQTVPLDMYSSSFRSNRIKLIEAHCNWLSNFASKDSIDLLLLNNWRSHFNELGILTNWGIIDNERDLLDLFNCLGIELMLKICEKFIENFNYWSSGMPDLVLWNSTDMRYEICEVKGPGDKLSDKQKIWIMELQKMNANVSLCQVEGVSHKKL